MGSERVSHKHTRPVRAGIERGATGGADARDGRGGAVSRSPHPESGYTGAAPSGRRCSR